MKYLSEVVLVACVLAVMYFFGYAILKTVETIRIEPEVEEYFQGEF